MISCDITELQSSVQGADTDPAAIARIDAAMAAGEPAGVEYITYAKNGAKFWSSLSVTPVHTENGELEHTVGEM